MGNETLPGGWIWDDMGNYYGAGSAALNWRENQYDLILRSGNNIGDTVIDPAPNPGYTSKAGEPVGFRRKRHRRQCLYLFTAHSSQQDLYAARSL
jgi:hypothetical protein